MSKVEFINYNGKLFPADEAVLKVSNRAFQYGDALFETMHSARNEVQFFDDHFNRLISGMKTLKMNVPVNFRPSVLLKEINRVSNRNKLYQGARIRLTVFRNPGGLYTPHNNGVSFVIESKVLDNEKYTLNKTGLIIDVFNDVKHPDNFYANLKTTNALPYIMAGIWKTENKLDDAIILNKQNHIVEAVSSNLFIYKNKKLYTPPLTSGCIAGIMREKIIVIAKETDITVIDQTYLTIDDLDKAEEIFLTNAVSGIRWVVGWKSCRYYNNIAKKFISVLNTKAFGE